MKFPKLPLWLREWIAPNEDRRTPPSPPPDYREIFTRKFGEGGTNLVNLALIGATIVGSKTGIEEAIKRGAVKDLVLRHGDGSHISLLDWYVQECVRNPDPEVIEFLKRKGMQTTTELGYTPRVQPPAVIRDEAQLNEPAAPLRQALGEMKEQPKQAENHAAESGHPPRITEGETGKPLDDEAAWHSLHRQLRNNGAEDAYRLLLQNRAKADALYHGRMEEVYRSSWKVITATPVLQGREAVLVPEEANSDLPQMWVLAGLALLENGKNLHAVIPSPRVFDPDITADNDRLHGSVNETFELIKSGRARGMLQHALAEPPNASGHFRVFKRGTLDF